MLQHVLKIEEFRLSDSVTIFEKIISREMPADIVYENDHVLAFKDINPQAPTHILVIPKKKFQGFAQLSKAEAADVASFIQGVSQVADELGLTPNGYRIVFNQGKHGQQTVDYIHAHILGGRQLSWPPG